MNPQERKSEIDQLWRERKAAEREWEKAKEHVVKLERSNTWSRDASSDLALAFQRFEEASNAWQASMDALAKGE